MSSGRSKAPDGEAILRVVINDASCLIDLHKVDLVVSMLGPPYHFVVALPVREEPAPRVWTAAVANIRGCWPGSG